MYIWLHLLELCANRQGELLIISHDTVTLKCSIYMYWLICAFKTVDILQNWSRNCHWVKFNLLFSKSIKNTMKSVTLGFTSFYYENSYCNLWITSASWQLTPDVSKTLDTLLLLSCLFVTSHRLLYSRSFVFSFVLYDQILELVMILGVLLQMNQQLPFLSKSWKESNVCLLFVTSIVIISIIIITPSYGLEYFSTSINYCVFFGKGICCSSVCCQN